MLAQWRYYGGTVNVQAELTRLFGQLDAIRQGWLLNKNLPPSPARDYAIAELRRLHRIIVNKIAELNGVASRIEQPAAVLVALDRFGDQVFAVGRDLGENVAGAVGAAGDVLRWLPWIAVGVGALWLLKR